METIVINAAEELLAHIGVRPIKFRRLCEEYGLTVEQSQALASIAQDFETHVKSKAFFAGFAAGEFT